MNVLKAIKINKCIQKIIFAFMLVIAFAPASYGATSGNTSDYLRVDVFEAKMDAIVSKIDALEKTMNTRFDAMDKRIDDVNTRVSDTQTMLYGGFTAIGVLMTLITFAPALWEYARNRKPALTIDDVKRLIAESKLETK